MKSYSPTESLEFTDSIMVCEETDEGHADKINDAPKRLLKNDLVLKNEINKVRDALSNIHSDAMNVSIPNHDAEFVFIQVGRQCIVIARHHVKGVPWDTASSGIYVPARFRPTVPKYLSGSKYSMILYESGVIGLHGEEGVDLWECGTTVYSLN